MKTNAEKDLALVKAYKSGDESAFAKIFNRYSESIKYRMFKGIGDMDIAEDLMMEVFTKVVEKIKSFDTNSGAFSTWLYRIATNHFVDYLRKNANYSVNSIEEMIVATEEGDFEFQISSDIENPEELLEREQRVDFAHELIASISNDMTREMVKLRFLEELSYEEIAERTGSPLGTVKGTLFRARNEMAKNAETMDKP